MSGSSNSEKQENPGGSASKAGGGDSGNTPAQQAQGTRGKGGGQTAAGGGGDVPGGPGGTPPPDDTKPLPPAATPPQDAAETVAPRDIPQSELSLRNVQDLLKDPEAAKKLSDELGLSPDQIEQFVQKYNKDKAPKAAARPGEAIQVKPGANRSVAPNSALPGLDPGANLSTKMLRERGAVPTDDVRNNIETTRFIAPPEVQRGFEAYQSTLNRSRTLNPTRTAPAPAKGAGPGSR